MSIALGILTTGSRCISGAIRTRSFLVLTDPLIKILLKNRLAMSLQRSSTMSNRGRYTLIAAIVAVVVVVLVVCVWSLVWYFQNGVPHTYPTTHTNIWWGFIHGSTLIPTFIWSLFHHDVTIYQSPNNGNWYNWGYVIGLLCTLVGTRGATKKRSKQSS